MIKKKLIFTGFLVLTALIGNAQNEGQEQLALSLNEAKTYALSYNRSIKSADLSIQKANQAKWQALSSMLPHVSAKAGYTNLMGYELDLGMSKIPMNPYGDLTIQASIAISGMQLVASELSKTAESMAQTSKSISELDVKTKVTNAYYSILIAEESKNLVSKTLENIQKLQKSTAHLYEVGMAEQTDADQMEVQARSIENNIRYIDRNIELTKNSLKLLLGAENSEIILTQTLNELIDENSIMDALMNPFDVNQNLNVLAINQNIELSKKQVSMKKWEYGPTLSAFYQYTAKTYFGESEGFNMTPPNTIGASLNIPIFSSGERLSKVRQAKIDVRVAELNKEEAIEGLLMQEKQLRFNLKSAFETYEVQKKNVVLYERIFNNTMEKYNLGTVSSTELTSVNNNLLQAQSSYISSLMELLSAQVNLQKLLNSL